MKPLFEDATPAKTATPVAVDLSLNAFPNLGKDLVPVATPSLPVAAPARAQSVQIVPPRYTEDQVGEIGATAASALSTVSSKMLTHVRSSDAGEFGKDLNALVILAKGLDPNQLKEKSLVGKLFGAVAMTKERLVAQYASVDKQMGSLESQLDGKATLHKQRINDLEQLYTNNFNYHQGLEEAVGTCEQMLVTVEADYSVEQTKTVGDSFGAQVLADYQRLIGHIEKRIDDLKRAMVLSKQTAPQIRTMQDDARALVQKFAQVKTVTLPAYRNAFQLYILQLEQKQAVELLNSVDDATDAALKKNATQLRQNTSAIATARNRSVVSIDTLTHVQSELIGSVEDVKRIDEEGRARRKAESVQLIAMEQELIKAFAPGKR